MNDFLKNVFKIIYQPLDLSIFYKLSLVPEFLILSLSIIV